MFKHLFSKKKRYSLDEQVVGTWIDGKPLYMRVIQATAPSAINTVTNVATIPANYSIKNITGIVDDGTGQFFSVNQHINVNNINNVITTWASIENQQKYLRMYITNSLRINNSVAIILEYTKTTD